MKKNQKRKGFTLTELIVVIAIIAILAAVLIPTLTGYIEKARRSNDNTLVNSLNRTVIPLADEDDLTSAENIRVLLKSTGINELKTSSSNSIIVFNTVTNLFELVTTDDMNTLVSGTVIRVLADGDDELRLNSNPTSLEEVFVNRLVVSTKGNPLSEALYEIHNLTVDTNVSNLLNKIGNDTLVDVIRGYIVETAFVSSEGNVLGVNADLTIATTVQNKSNIVINENATEISIATVAEATVANAILVIPNYVETVAVPEGEDKGSLVITGNVTVITDTTGLTIVGSVTDALSKLKYVPAGTLAELKDKIATGYKKIYLTSGFEVNEALTIPAGVTVTLPYDNTFSEDNQVFEKYYTIAADVEEAHKQGTSYVTLTLNANVVVDGTLNIGAVLKSYNGNLDQGAILKGSTVVISAGNQLTINGTLNSIGQITGEGSVYATGTINDRFWIQNWRGGSATLASIGVGVFPFSKYSLGNIEAKLTLTHTAKWNQNTQVSVNFIAIPISVCFAGDGGVFELKENSTLEKTVGENNKDVIVFNGGITDNAIELNISGMRLSTDSFALPLGNVSLTLKKSEVADNTSEFNEMRLKFLPGSEVFVESGATLTIDTEAVIFSPVNGESWTDKYYGTGNKIAVSAYPTGLADPNISISGSLILGTNAMICGNVTLKNGSSLVVNGEAMTTCVTKEVSQISGGGLSSKVSEVITEIRDFYVNVENGSTVSVTLPNEEKSTVLKGSEAQTPTTGENKVYTLTEAALYQVKSGAGVITITFDTEYSVLNADSTPVETGVPSYVILRTLSNTPMPVALQTGYAFSHWLDGDNVISYYNELSTDKTEFTLTPVFEELGTQEYNVEIELTATDSLPLNGAVVEFTFELTDEYIERLKATSGVTSVSYNKESGILNFKYKNTETLPLPTFADCVPTTFPSYQQSLSWVGGDDIFTHCENVNSLFISSSSGENGIVNYEVTVHIDTADAKQHDMDINLYNMEGAKIINQDLTVNNGIYIFKGNIRKTLPTPTKEGYTFDGWYFDADFQKVVVGTPQAVDGDLVERECITNYYAKWTEVVADKPEIVYNDNGTPNDYSDDYFSISSTEATSYSWSIKYYNASNPGGADYNLLDAAYQLIDTNSSQFSFAKIKDGYAFNLMLKFDASSVTKLEILCKINDNTELTPLELSAEVKTALLNYLAS